MKATKLDWRG